MYAVSATRELFVGCSGYVRGLFLVVGDFRLISGGFPKEFWALVLTLGDVQWILVVFPKMVLCARGCPGDVG